MFWNKLKSWGLFAISCALIVYATLHLTGQIQALLDKQSGVSASDYVWVLRFFVPMLAYLLAYVSFRHGRQVGED